MLTQATFAVDASLLQELGEKLIGRPAIALGELVKNAYDADAATCLIQFGNDHIVISDDGGGMSEPDFHSYWMRIGTTHKVDQRTSKSRRPLTGSKGIGRLSAQFLAHEMTLESTSADHPETSLFALVDWRNAVRGADLSTVNVGWEIRTDRLTFPGGTMSGTRITLKYLRSQWDSSALRNLGEEAWMLLSPFKRSPKRTKTLSPEDFDVEIEAPGVADAE